MKKNRIIRAILLFSLIEPMSSYAFDIMDNQEHQFSYDFVEANYQFINGGYLYNEDLSGPSVGGSYTVIGNIAATAHYAKLSGDANRDHVDDDIDYTEYAIGATYYTGYGAFLDTNTISFIDLTKLDMYVSASLAYGEYSYKSYRYRSYRYGGYRWYDDDDLGIEVSFGTRYAFQDDIEIAAKLTMTTLFENGAQFETTARYHINDMFSIAGSIAVENDSLWWAFGGQTVFGGSVRMSF
jgi:hypothetical protein